MTEREFEAGELYYIEWIDHSAPHDNKWITPESLIGIEPVKVETVGWCGNVQDEHVIIFSQRTDSDVFASIMCILKSCIKHVEKLT